MKITLAVCLALAFAAVSSAADCCHKKKLVIVKPVAFAVRPAVSTVGPVLGFARLVQQVPATDPLSCPHQRAVYAWYAWRAKHPNAKSRYPGGNAARVVAAVHEMAVTLKFGGGMISDDPDAMEPDPTPNGCGCDLTFALSAKGCGWWMSQVYGG